MNSVSESTEIFFNIVSHPKASWSGVFRFVLNRGCLYYVARRRDCSIGKLIINTSVFVRKREYLKIRLIVCLCFSRFGDPAPLIEFARWQCVSHKQPAKQNTLLVVIQLHVHCYILFSLSLFWKYFSQFPLHYHNNTWSTRVSRLSEH